MTNHADSVRASSPSASKPEPQQCEESRLWLYGNTRLLRSPLSCIPESFGPPEHQADDLEEIARTAQGLVLSSRVLIAGIHSPAHQAVATVPLRWGAPRILVLSAGFLHHMGESLEDEPYRQGRLWRYRFDERVDLVISRKAPHLKPDRMHMGYLVDCLILQIVRRQIPGELFQREQPCLPFG